MCDSNGEFSSLCTVNWHEISPVIRTYLHNFLSPQIMVMYYFTITLYITSVNFLQNIFFQVHDCKSIIISYRRGCSSNYQKMAVKGYDLQNVKKSNLKIISSRKNRTCRKNLKAGI